MNGNEYFLPHNCGRHVHVRYIGEGVGHKIVLTKGGAVHSHADFIISSTIEKIKNRFWKPLLRSFPKVANVMAIFKSF